MLSYCHENHTQSPALRIPKAGLYSTESESKKHKTVFTNNILSRIKNVLYLANYRGRDVLLNYAYLENVYVVFR